ncbi:MAG TPA: hypothetical protein VHZ98_14395 [Galbitalea sp.]|nr:hypothetical protein [Galbitalea sp.]
MTVAVPLAVAREGEGFQKPPSQFAVVGSRLDEYRTSVNTVVSFGTPASIVSPSGGLVTAVVAHSGDTVAPGKELFAVDYVPVVAFQASSPLYRDLSYGDTGSDAQVLTEFLSSTGYLSASSVGPRILPAVVVAIRKFQASIGQKQDGTFRVAYGAYVPPSVKVIGDSLLQVGDSVSPGTAAYSAEKLPSTMTFAASDQGTNLEPLKDSPVVFQLGSEKVALASLTPTSTEIAQVYKVLQDAKLNGTSQFTSSNSDGSVGSYSGGLLYLKNGSSYGVVPNSAIFISSLGAQCVFVHTVGSARPVPQKLTVSQATLGELGLTSVNRSLVGKTILRDPHTLSRDVLRTCK